MVGHIETLRRMLLQQKHLICIDAIGAAIAALEERDQLRQRIAKLERERDDALSALQDIREIVLHENGPLEVNAVLGIIDDNWPCDESSGMAKHGDCLEGQ